MTTLAKTIVATGATSGLGFEAIKQLLAQPQPYKFILGARDVAATKAAYDKLQYDQNSNSLTVLPLELANLRSTKSFAEETVLKLGQDKLDYLLLNAGSAIGAVKPNRFGSKWSEIYLVNHLSQHYLIHLLKEKLVASQSRIVVVSSGGVRSVQDPAELDEDLKDMSGVVSPKIYSETKFTQLLGAHWWRRKLAGQCIVVATSPGLVPGTGLGRDSTFVLKPNMPDSISVADGATNILRALTRDDFPEDPERIFLTSWGEWWPKDVYEKTLDRNLQDKWCPSKEDIEIEEGLLD